MICPKHQVPFDGYCEICAAEMLRSVPSFTPTKRQYYAAKAMQGLLAQDQKRNPHGLAENAFCIAAAMINFEEQGK